ncbi:hypothetical protein AYI69_g9129 [Smittium culicis]|uniref:Uncharacterized protein n=1 Tax=Smittium culicis TaxID=133412 RepID=A0A1R1XES5_9FUNG|nr:hypothetical protein AYI69_g9129 [Smittium culicis]
MSLNASGSGPGSIQRGSANLVNQDTDSKSQFFFNCFFNLYGLDLKTRRANAPYPEVQTDHFDQYAQLNSRQIQFFIQPYTQRQQKHKLRQEKSRQLVCF